jgi:predicted nucleotidyltransferase
MNQFVGPRIHVSDEELKIIRDILRSALSEELVYVFGSRSRGDHRRTSDIDVAIVGSKPMTMAVRSQLEFGFSESDLPFKVDVVDMLTVDEPFKKIIEADAVPLEYRP